MAAIKIQVEKRTGLGKNKVNKLRKTEFVPGVVYSRGEETEHIKVNTLSFDKVYRSAGTSTLIDLELEGDTLPVLIKEVQTHPYKNEYLHVDFQKLNMDETVKLTIPLILVGRGDIKDKESILMQQLYEIDIECLPGNIPESIEVNVSNIDLKTPIFVSDLEIFKNEGIVVFRDGEDVIANLARPTLEEEAEEEETIYPDEVPVVGEEGKSKE